VQEKNLALDRAHTADVVEREREHVARTLAEQANELKDQFLATVSHELRTPLTAMLGWLSMLRSGKLTPEKEANALIVIERNARVQAQLVDDLLDVSRIASGKLELDVKRVDLGAVIDEAVETVRPAAEAGGVRLAIDSSRAGVIDCDGRRLLQVIWNLLSNAVKFTPRGGSVVLEAERRGDSVEIVVSDTGVGIPPEFLPHVFERFQQAESSGARKLGGLGLGLSIVEHVVKAHGGDVVARSAGAGEGASFSVRVPVAPPQTDSP
jgi:signal transduction histidine kinase